MKKNIFIIACLAFALVGCKDKPKDRGVYEFLRPSTMDYTKQDSSNINHMIDHYTQLVEKKDFENASKMLYEVHNDSVKPLSAEKRNGFIHAYSQMPIYAARTENFVLRSDKNNQVDVLIQIMKDGDLEKGIGVSKMSLNPVYKNGKWYLTLLDKHAEGVQDVYDPAVSNY